jgi:hypothetical protein
VVTRKEVDENLLPAGKSKRCIIDAKPEAANFLELAGKQMYGKDLRAPDLEYE